MSAALNIGPFVDVDNMMRLVRTLGIETVLRDLAACIEAHFRRWPAFDMTARIASDIPIGVIELMPASDGLQTVTAFGLLAEVAMG